MTEELVAKANAEVGSAKIMSLSTKVDWTKLELVGITVIPMTKKDGSPMPEYVAGAASLEVSAPKYGKLALLAKSLRGAADTVNPKEPLIIKDGETWVLNPLFKLWRFVGYTAECKG